MNPLIGWTLAGVALAAGALGWGWRGVALAVTVIVFWLGLQFNRALRVMRMAADSPVGHVPSAVMLHARLRRGMALWQVITLTKSLGRIEPAAAPGEERFAWQDDGGATVRLRLRRGRLVEWQLQRAAEEAAEAGERP